MTRHRSCFLNSQIINRRKQKVDKISGFVNLELRNAVQNAPRTSPMLFSLSTEPKHSTERMPVIGERKPSKPHSREATFKIYWSPGLPPAPPRATTQATNPLPHQLCEIFNQKRHFQFPHKKSHKRCIGAVEPRSLPRNACNSRSWILRAVRVSPALSSVPDPETVARGSFARAEFPGPSSHRPEPRSCARSCRRGSLSH